MDPLAALKVFDDIAAQVPLKRNQHQMVKTAYDVIEKQIQELKNIKSESPSTDNP